MTPVVLIQVEQPSIDPSPDVLRGFSSVARLDLACDRGASVIAKSAIIASGLPTSTTGVDLPMVLEDEPLRLRPRHASDGRIPWVWEQAARTGLRTAVVGWPGLTTVSGADARMVSRHAFHQRFSSSGRWPLAGPFVNPPGLRDDVAAAQVSVHDLDDGPWRDLLDDLSSEQMVRRARLAIANGLSALAAMELMIRGGVDLAVHALFFPWADSELRPVAHRLLDMSIRRILPSTGDDVTLLCVSGLIGSPRVVIADRSMERPPVTTGSADLLDLTPTILARLGIDPPDGMTGGDLLSRSSTEGARFDLRAPEQPEETDLDRLVDLLCSNDGPAPGSRGRNVLHRYAVVMLHAKRVQAYRVRDFLLCRHWLERLVRLDSSAGNHWELAFACNRLGDVEGVTRSARHLLEHHPGTPEALLSAALEQRDRANSGQLEIILGSIEPGSFRSPSLAGFWARMSLQVGNRKAGVEVLVTLVRKGLALPVDRFALVSALMTDGEHEQAERYLGLVGSGSHGPLKWRILRARVLLRNGRLDEALDITNRILDSHPMERNAVEIQEQVVRLKNEP